MSIIQKQVIIFLLVALIYIVNGQYGQSGQYSTNTNCKRFENKVYQLNITFPNGTAIFAALRLLPNGAFDIFDNIEGGDSFLEFGLNISTGNIIGYYKCPNKNNLRLTGIQYIYQTEVLSGLQNGGVASQDYYLFLSKNDQFCTGSVRIAIYTSGINPFATKNTPLYQSPTGTIQCELLKFRTHFDLSDEV
jgi:hypothetical protein